MTRPSRGADVRFADRVDAGRRLAGCLQHLARADVVVLGLPRGGVPVAAEVARALRAPLDVLVVRKLGLPFRPELGMGAIGEGGVRVLNDDVIEMTGVQTSAIAAVERNERAELERRARRFRGDRPPTPLVGRTALVVDDGIATGSTARAACRIARARGAARVVLAVPVAPPGWIERIAGDADECVALATPASFAAVGQFYDDFTQTTDAEVSACLAAARSPAPRAVEVVVETEAAMLRGDLTVPAGATGIVVFAHGSGSNRSSPRNRFVADVLHRGGLATLLFDLLTPTEARDRANVFDIDLLATRLTEATSWVRGDAELGRLPVGYFGASTGAAAALWAAALPANDIGAVVSRGGRPDLAAGRLAAVTAPTLLIVGGEDGAVIALNYEAYGQLRCERRLVVVPGATHLFEEPGTLERAAELARDWFAAKLPRAHRATG